MMSLLLIPQVSQLPASRLAELSYLELLEMQDIPVLSKAGIEAVQERLQKEKEAEQDRLKAQEKAIENQIKDTRKELDALNKKRSRDTDEMSKQRTLLQCRVLDMENEERKLETSRNHGVPVQYQNKLAKLDLVQRWPAMRAEIERTIEAGRARERRFGNVEDIGVRDLGIDNLARKQTEDIEVGRKAIQGMQRQGVMPPVVEDGVLTDYIQKLGDKLAMNSDLRVPVKVTVLNSTEINAFALPGGFLYVNAGLINKAESETELVGVMAHELAHAAARHGPRLMTKATIANIIFQAAQISAAIFAGPLSSAAYYGLQYGLQGLGMVLDLTLLGVSRDYESEADQLGAQYAWKAGYDPKGFITFFDKMASEEGYVRSASFFRTHPPFLERILSTFSEIEYLPPRRELRLTSNAFDDAKKRVATLLSEKEKGDENRPSLRGPVAECSKVLGKPISGNSGTEERILGFENSSSVPEFLHAMRDAILAPESAHDAVVFGARMLPEFGLEDFERSHDLFVAFGGEGLLDRIEQEPVFIEYVSRQQFAVCRCQFDELDIFVAHQCEPQFFDRSVDMTVIGHDLLERTVLQRYASLGESRDQQKLFLRIVVIVREAVEKRQQLQNVVSIHVDAVVDPLSHFAQHFQSLKN